MVRLSKIDLVSLVWNYIDDREWHTAKIMQYLYCMIEASLLLGETAVAWRDDDGEIWINFERLAEIYEKTIKIVAPTFAKMLAKEEVR